MARWEPGARERMVLAAVDLFTGTTRVAREFKTRGIEVTATDLASYSEVLSDCYIATDAAGVDRRALQLELDRLNELPGEEGYESGRRIWNACIDRRPGLIARCSGVADVVHAVKFAKAHDLLVAVRGGHR